MLGKNYSNGSIVSVDMDVVGVMAAYLVVVHVSTAQSREYVCVLHSLKNTCVYCTVKRVCVCIAQSRECVCVLHSLESACVYCTV